MKFYYSNNGVTLRLMRDIRKKDPEAKCPLKWCITYKRDRIYYPTGKTLDQKDWDLFEKSEEPDFNFKTKAGYLKECKDDIQEYFEETLKKKVSELGGNFSFAALNKTLGRSDIQTLNDAIERKIKDLYSEDRINYAATFQNTINSLEKFKGKKIKFDSITPDFLKKYEKYLIDDGKTETTVGIYMRNIRTIINGDGDQYLKGAKYPFGKGRYIIPKGEGREKALKLEQIHLIQAYKCDKSMEIYRDMWLFSFYGNGINVTDICRLKYDDIRDGEISFVRKKTKAKRRTVVRIYVPIIKPVSDIIKKHGNKSKIGLIFPFLNNINTEKQRVEKINDTTRRINEAVQSVASELKLPDGITTYSTRHSYVTILEHLNVPRVFVSNSLGHTNESVTDAYSNMTEKELRFKYNSMLVPKSKDEIVKSLTKMELVYN